MPMSTSDLRQPVCVELACLQRHPAPKALPEATPNSLDSPGKPPSVFTSHEQMQTTMVCHARSSIVLSVIMGLTALRF